MCVCEGGGGEEGMAISMFAAVEAEALPLGHRGPRHSPWPPQLGATQRVATVVTLLGDGDLGPVSWRPTTVK